MQATRCSDNECRAYTLTPSFLTYQTNNGHLLLFFAGIATGSPHVMRLAENVAATMVKTGWNMVIAVGIAVQKIT